MTQVSILPLNERDPDQLIKEFYNTKKGSTTTFLYLCLNAKLSNGMKIAYLITGEVKKYLTQWKSLVKENLLGFNVIYSDGKQSNASAPNQLKTFKLGKRIPVSVENVDYSAYLAKIDSIEAVVIFVFEQKYQNILETEHKRILDNKQSNRCLSYIKSAYIEGHEASFLAIRIDNKKFEPIFIDGMEREFVFYTYFIGKQVTQKDTKLMNKKGEYFNFSPFTLNDYDQNRNARWGSFASEF